MSSPVRRSSRSRRPATTIYDEAAAIELERRKSLDEKLNGDIDIDSDSDDET